MRRLEDHKTRLDSLNNRYAQCLSTTHARMGYGFAGAICLVFPLLREKKLRFRRCVESKLGRAWDVLMSRGETVAFADGVSPSIVYSFQAILQFSPWMSTCLQVDIELMVHARYDIVA